MIGLLAADTITTGQPGYSRWRHWHLPCGLCGHHRVRRGEIEHSRTQPKIAAGAVRGSEGHPADDDDLASEKGHLLAKRAFFPRLPGGGSCPLPPPPARYGPVESRKFEDFRNFQGRFKDVQGPLDDLEGLQTSLSNLSNLSNNLSKDIAGLECISLGGSRPNGCPCMARDVTVAKGESLTESATYEAPCPWGPTRDRDKWPD